MSNEEILNELKNQMQGNLSFIYWKTTILEAMEKSNSILKETISNELENLSNRYDVIDGQYVIRKHDFDAIIENFKHNS